MQQNLPMKSAAPCSKIYSHVCLFLLLGGGGGGGGDILIGGSSLESPLCDTIKLEIYIP